MSIELLPFMRPLDKGGERPGPQEAKLVCSGLAEVLFTRFANGIAFARPIERPGGHTAGIEIRLAHTPDADIRAVMDYLDPTSAFGFVIARPNSVHIYAGDSTEPPAARRQDLTRDAYTDFSFDLVAQGIMNPAPADCAQIFAPARESNPLAQAIGSIEATGLVRYLRGTITVPWY